MNPEASLLVWGVWPTSRVPSSSLRADHTRGSNREDPDRTAPAFHRWTGRRAKVSAGGTRRALLAGARGGRGVEGAGAEVPEKGGSALVCPTHPLAPASEGGSRVSQRSVGLGPSPTSLP